MIYLDKAMVREAIGYLKSFLSEETTPGVEGRKAFIKAALGRDDFFPQKLQRKIDQYRGNIPTGEFLKSDGEFLGTLLSYQV